MIGQTHAVEPVKPSSSLVKSERKEAVHATPDSPLITMDGDVVGTPAFMSPEQASGRLEEMGPHSDVYAVGAMLYQLLTGHVPFNGENVANVAYQIVNSKYKSVRSLRSDLPSSAVRIVNKAMNRQPDKRFADAGEMAAEIRKRMQHDFKLSA